MDGALRGRIGGLRGTAPAAIVLQRDQSAWARTIHTANDGTFTMLDLVPGDYTLVAAHCAPQQIWIDAGDITDTRLDVSSCARRVTAKPQSAAPANVSDLPLLQWNPTALGELDSAAHDATLAAAPADETTGDESGSPEAARESTDLGASGPSVSGLSPTANSTLLDGLSTMQNFRSGQRGSAAGGPRTSATFNESATRAFKLQPSSYSAQYGSAGGLIAVTSRGLAERLHGTAFLLTRESAFAATNPFSVVTHYDNGVITSQLLKPKDSILQLGAAAGLPLSRAPLTWLRRASLFASLEGQVRSGQVVSTPATANFYRADRGTARSACKPRRLRLCRKHRAELSRQPDRSGRTRFHAPDELRAPGPRPHAEPAAHIRLHRQPIQLADRRRALAVPMR